MKLRELLFVTSALTYVHIEVYEGEDYLEFNGFAGELEDELETHRCMDYRVICVHVNTNNKVFENLEIGISQN